MTITDLPRLRTLADRVAPALSESRVLVTLSQRQAAKFTTKTGFNVGQVTADIPDGSAGETLYEHRLSHRVDVEFAHHCAVPCDEALTEAEIAGTAQVADALVAHLSASGFDVVTSVLIDDKKNAGTDIDERRHAAVTRCVEELGANRVMLESNLEYYLRDFSESLPAQHRTVTDGFFSRLRRTGSLACSQDVTIWHTLRLALFESDESRWAWDSAPEAAAPADLCVTVLPRRLQCFEEKAYLENFKDILGTPLMEEKRMTVPGHLGRRPVSLWAIWVDPHLAFDDLRSLGQDEAARITSARI